MTKNDTHISDRPLEIFGNLKVVGFSVMQVSALLLLLLGAQSIKAAGLSLAEQRNAADLAAVIPWTPPTALTPHPLGLQTLSVEKQERKGSQGTRLVRVYQYHYTHESARLLVVDLLDQTLVREQYIETIHLPLNQREIDHAIGVVEANPAVLEKLRAEQRLRQRPEFSNLAELDVKASIFEPMDSAHPCASQRCALLSLFDETRTVFSTEPVVYLGNSELELLAPQ